MERNELKSSLIYAETQLREVKAKHDDVEQLFRREEDEWTRRIDRANSAKLEQTESLEQVRCTFFWPVGTTSLLLSDL